MLDDNADVYVAKSLSLMNYLTAHGYPCVKVRDDDNNPEFKVFYFRRNKELEQLATDFINKRNERNANRKFR